MAQKSNNEYKYILSKETAIVSLMENGLNELEKELKIYKIDPISKRNSTILNDLNNMYKEKDKLYNDTVASKIAAIAIAERNIEDSKELYLSDVNILLLKKQLNDTYQELGSLTAIRQDDYYVRSNISMFLEKSYIS